MYSILKATVQPYLALLMLQAVVLAWVMRRKLAPKRATYPLVGSLVLLFAMSMPGVGRLMMATLEWSHPPLTEMPEQVDAIIGLGGGLSPPNDYQTHAQVSSSSYSRCLYAASLYKSHKCPLILCGGATEAEDSRATEAGVMADALTFLGVARDDMILESTSKSTRENAVQAVSVMKKRHFEPVLLVTHARHMNRAERCFTKLGHQTIAAPCGAESADLIRELDETWIPQVDGMSASSWVVKEWMALLYYRIRGWN